MYVLSVSSKCCKSIYGRYIYMHVAIICFKCFRCFIRMLQVFHLDVAKIDLDVCVYNGFQVFSGVLLVFPTYVASVSAISGVCCKCFIWMLQN
jgi:hypothetical protein